MSNVLRLQLNITSEERANVSDSRKIISVFVFHAIRNVRNSLVFYEEKLIYPTSHSLLLFLSMRINGRDCYEGGVIDGSSEPLNLYEFYIPHGQINTIRVTRFVSTYAADGRDMRLVN